MSETTADPALADVVCRVLVGVDAGATKTVALAVTSGGERVGRAETDGANPKRHGLDVAADRIAAVAVAAVTGAGGLRLDPGLDPALLFVAGAGIDRPEQARALEAALARRLRGVPVHVANDTLAVLRAGTPDGVGLVVPVSTGGNVIGRSADGRVTDRGHGIFGGAYVLGALAARAARRRTRSTSPAVGSVGPALRSQIEAAQLDWRGRRPAPEVARLGAAVVAAAQAGDPYPARMIARWCGRVEAAVREEADRLDLGPSPVVILYGGLVEASPWLEGRIRDAVRRGVPGAKVERLKVEPVVGAVSLALDAWAGHAVRWEFTPRR